jgi:hypothetical protein
MVLEITAGCDDRSRRESATTTIDTSPMYTSNDPSDLSGRQQLDLLLLVAMPVLALAVFGFAPAYTAPALALAVVVTVVSAEDIARTLDLQRTGRGLRGVIALIIGVSVTALGALGVVIIRGRGAELTLIVPGALVGMLLAMALVGLVHIVEQRPLVARWGVALVFVVLLVAAVWIASHLVGIATHGRQAALAASGILGFIVGVGLFLARDIM